MRRDLALTVGMAVALILGACSDSGASLSTPDSSGRTEARSSDQELVVVMDASGSMGAKLEEQTRSEVARAAFGSLLDVVPAEVAMGLVIMPGTCRASLEGEAPAVLSTSIAARYRSAVDDSVVVTPPLPGGSSTPVGATLDKAASLFTEGAEKKTLVLISDGEEGCGKPPCQVARSLIADGFDVTVHAIGFQISDVGAGQLRCVAETTGGSFYDIRDAASLEGALIEAATEGGVSWLAILFAGLGAGGLVVGGVAWRRSVRSSGSVL